MIRRVLARRLALAAFAPPAVPAPRPRRYPRPPAAGRGDLFRPARPVREWRSVERSRRAEGRPAGHRLRSDRQGLLPRRRPQGPDQAARLYPGARRDRALGRRRSSRTSRCRGRRASESAGYHGYWITDFTHVDPHLGTNADFKALVDAAHARGMKVYMDIIANHTADVIKYRECDGRHALRRTAAAPTIPTAPGRGRRARRSTRASLATGRQRREFRQADRPDLRLHAVRPQGRGRRQDARRGSTTRSTTTIAAIRPSRARVRTLGDFSGLDDLMTENPRVVAGMIDIFGDVDRQIRRRRLPHRHRAARQSGVLAGVRPRDAGARQGQGHPQLPHLRRGRRPARWTPRGSPNTPASTGCPRCSTSRSRAR